MLYFATRALARAFAKKTNRKPVDNGANALRRWGVKVI